MMDLGMLLTYTLIVLGFVFIPGPATLLTVARATSSGTKAGIATGAGIAVGDLVHTVLAMAGISALLAASATLFTAVKVLGAAYLFVLGIQAIRAQVPAASGEGLLPISTPAAFRQGLMTEVLNPKTALFFLAFLPQFVDPARGAVALQLLVLGGLFVLLGLFSTIVFATTAGSLGAFLRRSPTLLKWQGRGVGGVYCLLGLRLAVQDR